MNIIADKIAQRRKELGLTQKELAEKLYVTDKTVSRWETGKQIPDALMMQHIAAALDMPLSQLYGAEKEEMRTENNTGDKAGLYRKIRKIFIYGLIGAAIIIVLGISLSYISFYSLKNNTSVYCSTEEFPMYALTGYDGSVAEWVEYCNEEGKMINHISSLKGDTAYLLLYLPRGCADTTLEYSCRQSVRGPVLELNFKGLGEETDDKHYLCYMKFPCEEIFYLKTYIDGEAVESNGQRSAGFVDLCEMIFR